MLILASTTTILKAIVLDRDGTLIQHIPYLCDPSQVRLLPYVKEGIDFLRASKLMLFMHTNQSGVCRGLFNLSDVERCNERLEGLLSGCRPIFRDVCVATELPDAKHSLRKPSPTFANEIMQTHGLRPCEICYVGDSVCDLMTAINAGTSAIGVNTGLVDLHSASIREGIGLKFPIVNSFAAVCEIIASNFSCQN